MEESGSPVLHPGACGASCSRLSSVEELHLCDLGGVCLAHSFAYLRSLRYIWLNRNCLRSLSPLSLCCYLKEVYADNNELCAIPSLSGSRNSLEILSLAENRIHSVEEQCNAVHAFKRLRTLNLLGNPITAEARYRARVVQATISLQLLDCLPVTVEERKSPSVLPPPRGTHSIPKAPRSNQLRQGQMQKEATAAFCLQKMPDLSQATFSPCEAHVLRAAALAEKRQDRQCSNKPTMVQQLLRGTAEGDTNQRTVPESCHPTDSLKRTRTRCICNSGGSKGYALADWQLEAIIENLLALGSAALRSEIKNNTSIAGNAASAAGTSRRISRMGITKQSGAEAVRPASAAPEAATLPCEEWRRLCFELQEDPWLIGASLSPAAVGDFDAYLQFKALEGDPSALAGGGAAAAVEQATTAVVTTKLPSATTGSKARAAAATALAAANQQQLLDRKDTSVDGEPQRPTMPVREFREWLLQQQWQPRNAKQIREAVECLYSKAQQQMKQPHKALATARHVILAYYATELTP
ncbi:leucine-rich repeat-containing protein 72 isoform x1 [Cyclospora cayetanensis]|uniref:Leucine-rich repeat-containing protein 72 isoform x1 n=1 Tax=Cyclospora cayetanensis TaxID=88456 RepID=A0A1D3CTD1_9EIME|nr:leucine-rich repeat-containing protein 72 isoform x1 [Cyclospora cayetanensis]